MAEDPGVSTGIDLVSIPRIRSAARRRGFLERVFTPAELESAKGRTPERRLAELFAAKEASAKALGVGFGAELSHKEIEVYRDGSGRPFLRLSGGALKLLSGRRTHLSLSSTGDVAVALVVIE